MINPRTIKKYGRVTLYPERRCNFHGSLRDGPPLNFAREKNRPVFLRRGRDDDRYDVGVP